MSGRIKKSAHSVADAIIDSALAAAPQTHADLWGLARRVASARQARIPPTAVLRRSYLTAVRRQPSRRSPALDRLLVRRGVRSLSGVAVITVLTKPFPCPGRCVYCPTDARMPKSYLPNEPAAARGLSLKFNPYRQVAFRLKSLNENGHPVDKIELIVKGGTWSSYPPAYQDWFIKRCFDAANAFGRTNRPTSRTLAAAQKINETAGGRIIGLTLETRPDCITPTEVVRLRRLGCTRVELGVQSVNERVLALVKRGHDAAAAARAACLLKSAGFKTDFHMMPQLPDATPASDRADIEEIFDNPDFRPDMIKIYPCVVVAEAELYGWWRDGRYRPYSDKKLLETLIAAKQKVPRYCRISRLIRDIPSDSIAAGNAVTNLRETVQREMKKRGLKCACLRCREIGHAVKEQPRLAQATPKLFDDIYEASGGTEHFLSFEDRQRRGVFAFCRLRLPSEALAKEGRLSTSPSLHLSTSICDLLPELHGAALIRELHTYGHLVPIADRDARASQHKGLGRRLMAEAEKIASKAGFKKMAVIAGVGVRGYYRQLGYQLRGTYMVKDLGLWASSDEVRAGEPRAGVTATGPRASSSQKSCHA